jgi:hypothetical protein
MNRLEWILTMSILVDVAGVAGAIGDIQQILAWGAQMLLTTTMWIFYKRSIL